MAKAVPRGCPLENPARSSLKTLALGAAFSSRPPRCHQGSSRPVPSSARQLGAGRHHDKPVCSSIVATLTLVSGAVPRQPAGQRCVAVDLRFADDTERSRAVSSVPGTRVDAAVGSLSPLARSIGVALAGIGDRCQQERHGCRRQVILKGTHV
jgi:hypothetical protein